MPSRRPTLRRPVLLGLCAALLAASPVSARVLSIEIERRVPILGGAPLGAGLDATFAVANGEERPAPRGRAYELVEGRVRFGFDPAHPANARVTDLALAPRNAEGLVEATADFVVLQAIDPAQRSGTALVDVPNRGRRLALAGFNRVERSFTAPATLDPDAPADWGDGFLMAQGLSLFWVGWQADAPSFPGSMGLRVPRATQPDGQPVRGLARSDWVVDTDATALPLAALGHAPHRAADPSSSKNVLTRRRGREATRESVPRSAWRFDEAGDAIVATEAPFAAGWIYELVYVAEAPPLVGLGFAAFRDFAAWAESDPESPFAVERTIAHGLSQSGRFLRHFLHDGFNQDESGRRVFDGMMIQIAGAGRGGFNHRFSHPGRVGNPYANFFYPGDDPPFTSRPSAYDDRVAGLFDRAVASDTLPRVFQINTGYEYWGRGAALVHMRADGMADVPPHPNERLYHFASAPHYSLPFPPSPEAEVAPGLVVGSSVDTTPHQRALLVRLLAWVERDVAPPPSTIPTIAGGTLVSPASLRYPISALTPPRTPHVAYRMDYGPGWSDGRVDHQPPRRGAAYAIRVPGLDALGSEASGVRPLELRVPIGTYTPWALRHGQPGGADEMTGYVGSFWPLAPTAKARAAGDARPALDERYASRDAYESEVFDAIDALVEAGFMLPTDRRAAFEAAMARWDWARSRGDR